MALTSIGDLAQTLMLKGANARLNIRLYEASATVASGLHQNLAAELSGDFHQITAIENNLATLSAYEESAEQAAFFISQQQAVLENISDLATDLSADLISADVSDGNGTLTTVTTNARQAFEQTVAYLNASSGGRSMFSGTAVDTAAIQNPHTMLSQIGDAISGATTSAEAADIIRNWFLADDGAYATTVYQGTIGAGPAYQIGNGQTVQSTVTALDPMLRATMAEFAIASLVSDASTLTSLGETVLSASAGLADLSGSLGAVEARVEFVLTANAATSSVLAQRRAEIVAPDLYEAAVELEEVEQMLERLYLVTTRVSDLKLSDYI